MIRRAKLITGAIVVLAAGGTTAAVARDTGPDTAAILTSTLGEAMASAHNAFTIPEAAAFGRVAAAGHIAQTPALLKRQASPAALESQRVAGKKELARMMTGKALEKNLAVMNRWLDSQAPGGNGDPAFRPLGGGVSSVRLSSFSVNGDTATVKAEVDEWAAMADLAKDGSVEISKPKGTTLVDAHFVQVNGRWLVDEYTWTFAPGSAP